MCLESNRRRLARRQKDVHSVRKACSWRNRGAIRRGWLPAAVPIGVLVAGSLAVHAGNRASAIDEGPPTLVLVELFTSEGCSSCPPADKLLERMVGSRPAPDVQVVGLGEHVDYWDRLGWKDRFSSTEFTTRQDAYVDRFGTGPAYTPMMVVDGATAFVGSDGQAARRALEQAARARHGRLTVDRSQGSNRSLSVTVTASDLPTLADEPTADIIVAIVEDGLRSTVTGGENAGKVLTHTAVTRSMRAIGQTSGSRGSAHAELAVAADWVPGKLKIVAFVQARKSRRVLATTTVPVEADRTKRIEG
jgi:hypothetical protein